MIKQLYYWPRLAQQVELHVKACEKCFFHNEGFRTKPKMYMKLYEQRNEPNYRCYIDTMGPITLKSGATKHIFLATCAFTKFVTGAVLNNLTAPTIARAFLNSHVLHHGVPNQVICDNGSSISRAEFIQSFYQLIGVQQSNTTIYHPQANMVEQTNESIKAILSKIVHGDPNNWPSQLQFNLFC